MIYRTCFKNWNFGCAKTPRIVDGKSPHISNIGRLAIDDPREFSHQPKSGFRNTFGIILGSQSPARKEILRFFSLPFIQKSADIDEESFPFDGDPEKYTRFLAEEKGRVLGERFPDETVLTADTVVFYNGQVYNKPKSREEAFEMLSTLSGQWHQVFTSVAIRRKEFSCSAAEASRVLVNDLTPQQIQLYHEKIDFSNKAGGYTIQKAGSLIINRIEGCFYNVMGLPINTLRNVLLKAGIDLWHYIA